MYKVINLKLIYIILHNFLLLFNIAGDPMNEVPLMTDDDDNADNDEIRYTARTPRSQAQGKI